MENVTFREHDGEGEGDRVVLQVLHLHFEEQWQNGGRGSECAESSTMSDPDLAVKGSDARSGNIKLHPL